MAARAFIRHRFTDYEDRLGDLDVFLAAIDDADHREVKQDAQARVDQFLADHRAHPVAADQGWPGFFCLPEPQV